MIKNNHLILSQSETKELGLYVIDDQVEEIEWCPKRYYHKYIAEDYPQTPSESMLNGLYAETLLLGSSAHGEKVDEIPKKKNGESTTQEIRIKRQMDRMYGYLFAHGVTFNKNNTQVPLIAPYKQNVWLRGEFDIFPTTVNGQTSIVDIKTTKDIYSDFFSIADKWIRRSANSCWGSYNQIVKNQPLFYHWIARHFHETDEDMLKRFAPDHADKIDSLLTMNFKDVNFWFFVAGIGKASIEGQLAKYEYEWTEMRRVLLDALVQNSITRVKEGIKTNFEARPNENICNGCALKDVCKFQ